MDTVILIFENYLIPFVYALGVIYFIYGCIEYYLVKDGEDVEQHGRELLFKSVAFFFFGLLLFGVVAGLVWIQDAFTSFSNERDGDVIKIEHESRDSYLPVPDVPGV